ncbi:unnamed protein product [Zymoseptoria tritici ST99CH_1E4]|uniref:Uncharacterized protein n=1 Tax=Zymoseptoria tritici ST99CH_1E4 TaxID=1276532 RepID=A0A2H1FJJ1_ZYMTR|nr:unnamed protein product [Zymoseptoria tritici ST99CH_1E4]
MPQSSWAARIGLLYLSAIATANEGAPPVDLGGYIRAGLSAYTPSSNDTGSIQDLLTCASSWSSYSATLPTRTTNFGQYTTFATTGLINTTLVYGTGDVYTTIDNIPVARGVFTPTLTTHTVVTVVTKTSSYVTNSQPQITNTPSCSFSPADCSKLYVSYISSLGLPSNASVPKITPAPANSPPCPEYYYKPFSTCSASTLTGITADCKLYGNSVELFYFPSRTDDGPEPTAPPTYSYAPGVTFTSPSIYLSFDYLSGLRFIPNTVNPYCTTCDERGCRTAGVGGGDQTASEGTTIAGRILTMAPQDVSSMVLKLNDSVATALIHTLAGNLPGYGDVAPKVALGAVIAESLTPERLRIEDIAHPPPRAYYLRAGGAPGCGKVVQEPRCATIFEADYRAIISLPSEASLLQDAWATCNPAIYGVYDPPIALTQAQVADSITAPPGYEPASPSYTAQPVTIAPPLAAPGTVLEANIPAPTLKASTSPSPDQSTVPALSPESSSTAETSSEAGSSSGESSPQVSAASSSPQLASGSAGRTGPSSIICMGVFAFMGIIWAL